MGTFTSGRPTDSACASSRASRTACMATRAYAALTVVSRATTSTSPRWRVTCSAQALSFPVLQDIQALGRLTLAPRKSGSAPTLGLQRPLALGDIGHPETRF